MTYISTEGRMYLEQLFVFAEELGHVPSFKEVNDNPNLPPANNFAYYFGSYSDAAEIVKKKLELKRIQAEFAEDQITDYDDENNVDDDDDDELDKP